jgi:hypothetical protein
MAKSMSLGDIRYFAGGAGAMHWYFAWLRIDTNIE